MSEPRAERLLQAAHKASEGGTDAVLAALSELADNLGDAEAATDLANILSAGVLPAFETAGLLSEIFALHEANEQVMLATGGAMETARDIDDLNAPPPDQPLFANMVRRLAEIQLATDDPKTEAQANEALAATARLMARQRDDIAESAYARNIELFPRAHGRITAKACSSKPAVALPKVWPPISRPWRLPRK